MKKLLTLLPLFMMATGCGQAPGSTDASVLSAKTEAWEAALNAGDVDGIVALYTSDARILPPDGDMASGSDAIRAEFVQMTDAGLTGDLTSIEAVVSGDIGWDVGTYTLMAGDEVAGTGKFIETFRRGDDGEWRITNDIWNSDMPAADGSDNALLMIAHEVDDAEHWMAAWRGDDSRHDLFKANGADHVHTFVSADNPNMTGLIVAVSDMDALNAMLQSEEGQAAAAADGVRMDTLELLTEAE